MCHANPERTPRNSLPERKEALDSGPCWSILQRYYLYYSTLYTRMTELAEDVAGFLDHGFVRPSHKYVMIANEAAVLGFACLHLTCQGCSPKWNSCPLRENKPSHGGALLSSSSCPFLASRSRSRNQWNLDLLAPWVPLRRPGSEAGSRNQDAPGRPSRDSYRSGPEEMANRAIAVTAFWFV